MSTASLWRHRDFVALWSAQTISTFGSLITRAALPFLAILVLHASAADIAALNIAGLLPGFLIGLLAGVWVDRLRRRRVMIATDIGRALVLGLIPLLAATGHLSLLALYLVAIAASALTVFFDVAEQSYIPSVVAARQLVDANSKLTATQSISEVTAFGVAGWLVQWFTAPVAIGVDAVTFLASALLVGSIRTAERPSSHLDRPPRGIWREMVEGLGALRNHSLLRPLTFSVASMEAAYGVLGTVYPLYALNELGFRPGLLGLVYALGGVSSLAAAIYAGRINRRFGLALAIVLGLALAAAGTLFLPLARGAGLAALLLLVAQQLVGDGGATIAQINQTSLRQTLSPPELLGRINGGTRFAALGATVAGIMAGGALGQTIGYRPTLLIGALLLGLGGLAVLRSPLRHAAAVEPVR